MFEKISYVTAHEVCEALAIFANARLSNDKDLVLMVTKVDGRETLTTTRLSDMRWYQRLIRWFGFGPRTVYSVARFLNECEPYLPSRFSQLKADDPFMRYHYLPADSEAIASLSKERYKQMKEDKAIGFETFKRCVVHHNQKICCSKVYLNPHEHEKISLTESESPMGEFPSHNVDVERKMAVKYKAPRLDLQHFEYLDQPHRQLETLSNVNALGFCFEYGLGLQKDLKKALSSYEAATQCNPDDMAALYNLARLKLTFKKEPGKAKALFTTLQQKVAAKMLEAKALLSKARQQLESLERHLDWEVPEKGHLIDSLKNVCVAKDSELKRFERLQRKTHSALNRC